MIKGQINARLFDLGDYPGAKPEAQSLYQVAGELCEIDPKFLENVLKELDEYEGYEAGDEQSSLFIRQITTVMTDLGESVKAWVYWYNGPVNEVQEIETGDYKMYLSYKSTICP